MCRHLAVAVPLRPGRHASVPHPWHTAPLRAWQPPYICACVPLHLCMRQLQVRGRCDQMEARLNARSMAHGAFACSTAPLHLCMRLSTAGARPLRPDGGGAQPQRGGAAAGEWSGALLWLGSWISWSGWFIGALPSCSGDVSLRASGLGILPACVPVLSRPFSLHFCPRRRCLATSRSSTASRTGTCAGLQINPASQKFLPCLHVFLPQVLMATLKDEYRKPDTGMWDFFVQHMNAGVQPDIRQAPLRCCRCLAAVCLGLCAMLGACVQPGIGCGLAERRLVVVWGEGRYCMRWMRCRHALAKHARVFTFARSPAATRASSVATWRVRFVHACLPSGANSATPPFHSCSQSFFCGDMAGREGDVGDGQGSDE